MSLSAHELEFESEVEEEWEEEGEFEDEGEDFLGSIARLAQNVLGSAEMREAEAEDEFEAEEEWEAEANPQLRAYPDALMEHLGHAAAEAESEAEAEAFIAAAIPLAAQLLPKALPAIMKAAPQLVRTAGRVTRALRRNPSTRRLVKAMPSVIRRTTRSLARQAAQGRTITPRRTVSTFKRQTAGVIGSPQQCAHVWRQARAADRTYHRATGTPVAHARTTPPGPVPVRRRANGAASGPAARPTTTSTGRRQEYCICCGRVAR